MGIEREKREKIEETVLGIIEYLYSGDRSKWNMGVGWLKKINDPRDRELVLEGFMGRFRQKKLWPVSAKILHHMRAFGFKHADSLFSELEKQFGNPDLVTPLHSTVVESINKFKYLLATLRNLEETAQEEVVKKKIKIALTDAESLSNEFDILTQVVEPCLTETELESKIHHILENIVGFYQADRGLILFRDELLEKLVPVHSASRHDTITLSSADVNHLCQTIAGKVFKDGQIRYIKNAMEYTKPDGDKPKSITVMRINTILCLPIVCSDQVAGVLYLDKLGNNGSFANDDVEFVEVVASQIGLLLENVQTNKFNKRLMEDVPVGILVFDEHWHLIESNTTARKLLFDGKHIKGKLDPETYTWLFPILDQADRKRAGSFQKISLSNTRGNEFRLQVTSSGILNPLNKRYDTVIVFQDVTEYDRLEEQLHLKQKLAVVGDTVFQVAHDFKNPAGYIKNYNEYIRSFLSSVGAVIPADSMLRNDVDKMLHFSKRIEEGACRICDMVDSMKEFTHGVQLSVSDVGIEKFIDRVVQSFLNRADIDAAKVTFKTTVQEDIGSVTIDGFQIERVIDNLLINAYEAVTSNKPLVLDIKVMRKNVDHRNKVVIGITDDGPGIPARELEKIFLPYYTTKGSHGSGLGLANCMNIMIAHNGTIKCVSEVGKGTSFILLFPA